MDTINTNALNKEIITLKRYHEAQVLDILPKAFKNDPMFQYLFTGETQMKHLQSFFKFVFYKSILLKELPIGVKEDNVLKAVANIELPNSIKGASLLLKPAFIYSGIKLFCEIPKHVFTFINKYMQITSSVRPKTPHHYLVFIGVDIQNQGKGIGKILLNHIHELVDKDPLSTGIGLDTENPINVKIYKSFGYKVVEEKKIDDITIYCMFRSRIPITSP